MVSERESLDRRIAEARIALEAGTTAGQEADAVRKVPAEIRPDFDHAAARGHPKGVAVVLLTGDLKAFDDETRRG